MIKNLLNKIKKIFNKEIKVEENSYANININIPEEDREVSATTIEALRTRLLENMRMSEENMWRTSITVRTNDSNSFSGGHFGNSYPIAANYYVSPSMRLFNSLTEEETTIKKEEQKESKNKSIETIKTKEKLKRKVIV